MQDSTQKAADASGRASNEYTLQEMMVCSAARQLKNGERIFVGIGIPVLASLLAKNTHAPNAILLFESGIFGSNPNRVALSIADPGLVSDSVMLLDFFDLFSMYLQKGNVDVGFVGGGQVDKLGNVNSTAIGAYAKPSVRLPGGGGAYDMTMARRTIIIMPQEKRRFVEKVDFVTTPGYSIDKEARSRIGLGGGPESVITSMGIMKFDQNGEMFLESCFPNVSVEDIKQNTGWDLKVSPQVSEVDPPTRQELGILRSLDRRGLLLKRR